MKDLHNHLLYGIDDGSKDLASSVKLLKEIKSEGVDEIIFTPHYIIGSEYNANNTKKMKLLKTLKAKTKIKVYLGNEVFLDNNIIEYIKNKEISTLNNSRYILIEFPINEKMSTAEIHLENLIRTGYVPIIAHPERYHYYDLDFFGDLIREGCLMQGNITSLCGRYGRAAKHNLKLMIKKDMIHFIGTDIHTESIPLNDCYIALSKIVTKEKYKEITSSNFMLIVKDKPIIPYPITRKNKLLEIVGIDKIK